MPTSAPVLLADLTTLRVGGPAATLVEATTEAEVVAAVRTADATSTPLLILGGGSNLLVSDDGFPGTVVRIQTTGVATEGELVRVAAGENWDRFVADMVSAGRTGVETLAGIPGLVGATPVQNVGAYGSDVAHTIVSVRAFDRSADEVVTLSNDDCGFAYRTSIFKHSDRYVVLEVTYALPVSAESIPIRYAELARALGVEIGATAPLHDVRDAVLRLRRGKGMVLDDADHDTWSAGSFFTNPILTAAAAAELPEAAPRFAAAEGVKTSAAWLIEQAGFPKGYGTGAARLSTKHTLALTNRGGATAADVVALAREIRDAVRDRFGIELVPEPVFVGVEL